MRWYNLRKEKRNLVYEKQEYVSTNEISVKTQNEEKDG